VLQFRTIAASVAVAVVVVLAGIVLIVPRISTQTSTASPTPAAFQNLSSWEGYIAKVAVPSAGCYNATFPSTSWTTVPCATAPSVPSVPSVLQGPDGNGNDQVAYAPSSTIVSSEGTIGPLTQVTSEYDGIIGPNDPNEFSLQINAQPTPAVSTAFTGSSSNYQNGWAQFMVHNDPAGHYGSAGTSIYIQYWLDNYAAQNGGTCPSNIPSGIGSWMISGPLSAPTSSCFANSPSIKVPTQTVSNLANDAMWGQIQNGLDEVVFCDRTVSSCATASARDSVIDLSQYWNSSEFNILGLGDGSEAIFNQGAGMQLTNTVVTDQGGDLPLDCINDGFTGETNNLNFVPQPESPEGLTNCTLPSTGEVSYVQENGTIPPTQILLTGVDDTDGYGSVTPNCPITSILFGCLFDVGGSVTITAIPSAGFAFADWEAPPGVPCFANPCTFTMPSSPVDILAAFVLAPSPQNFAFTIGLFSLQTPVAQGSTSENILVVSATSGVPQPVTLYLSPPNFPAGVTLHWSQNPVTVTGSVNAALVYLNISTTCSTNVQQYNGLRIGGSGGGAAAWSHTFSFSVTASSSCSPKPPYHLHWLGAPQPVMSLDNGYWDNMGQLLTVGTAAYTCYANTSAAGGVSPSNLYLVTNESGSWRPYLAGAPLSAMGGDPTCSITTGRMGGHTVEFIAYLSPQLDPGNLSLGLLPSIELTYDPSGNPQGPWVNISVDPPGVGVQGSIGGNYPDGPSVAIWNNQTIAIAYQDFPPIDTSAPTPSIYVESLPITALPSSVGGAPSQPWYLQFPGAGDCSPLPCTGFNAQSDSSPVITANPAGIELVFQRGCSCIPGSGGIQLGYYRATVNSSSNLTWATGAGDPYVVGTYLNSSTLGMAIGLTSTDGDTDLAAYTNASSVGLELEAAIGSGTSWTNVSLGSTMATTSAVFDTPGVTADACGLSIGDTINTNSNTGTVVPAVWTFNDSAWTSTVFGPTNLSNQVPYFVDVAAQGQYVDTLFVNQPPGIAPGTTVFYADQAVCTNLTVNSVAIHPGSATLRSGESENFTAEPTCLEGLCSSFGWKPTYSWRLTNSSLGTLSESNGSSVNFTAGSFGGTAELYVNSSLNNYTVQSPPVSITIVSRLPSLYSVSIAPDLDTIHIGGQVVLAASDLCRTGACPSGATYHWWLSNSLGTLNSTTTQATTFTAGGSPGSVFAWVNVTLYGRSVESLPAVINVTTSSVPPLASVRLVLPSGPTYTGGTHVFGALATCTGGTCLAGATFGWSLSNTLGHLSTPTGPSVEFTAGSAAGNVTLFVNVTLNGVTQGSSSAIVLASNESGPSTSTSHAGVPISEAYALVAGLGIAAGAVTAAVLLVRNGNKGGPGRQSSPPIGDMAARPPEAPVPSTPSRPQGPP
jgi:hypothetical protein